MARTGTSKKIQAQRVFELKGRGLADVAISEDLGIPLRTVARVKASAEYAELVKVAGDSILKDIESLQRDIIGFVRSVIVEAQSKFNPEDLRQKIALVKALNGFCNYQFISEDKR